MADDDASWNSFASSLGLTYEPGPSVPGVGITRTVLGTYAGRSVELIAERVKGYDEPDYEQ